VFGRNNQNTPERGFTMAIISQQRLFVWKEIEELGDLERLKLVIETLPDDNLMRIMEKERANGRNKYPVRAVWNSILAGVVFQHISNESLRRELLRNAQLREMCGFYGPESTPPKWVYSRFVKKLIKHTEEIEKIFEDLVTKISEILPNFGEDLAIDSKAIQSLAPKESKDGESEKEDGRKDTDANWGRKEYRGKKTDGSMWEKVIKWFGYKVHLIVDANYELPVAYSVTKASEPDINEAHKMMDELKKKRPQILEKAETLEADRGYDDTKLIKRLWDDEEIKPVIDIRNMWKDKEQTRVLPGYENVTYNYQGQIYCYCPETGARREMAAGGFEESRKTIKKLCPAKQYGIECQSYGKCPVDHGIRIPLETDRRIFTPIDRTSYKWKRYYNKRTAVERVNSRLDESFGFEKHYIRGLKKMTIRCGIALNVMLAMSLGRIRQNQMDKIRSLVKSA
jgi:hypothetical protein